MPSAQRHYAALIESRPDGIGERDLDPSELINVLPYHKKYI